MKKSKLRQIIKEEIQNILSEKMTFTNWSHFNDTNLSDYPQYNSGVPPEGLYEPLDLNIMAKTKPDKFKAYLDKYPDIALYYDVVDIKDDWAQIYQEPNPFPKNSWAYWKREALNKLNNERKRKIAAKKAKNIHPDIEIL